LGFDVFNGRVFSANAAGTLVEGVVPRAEGRSDLSEGAKDVVVAIKLKTLLCHWWKTPTSRGWELQVQYP